MENIRNWAIAKSSPLVTLYVQTWTKQLIVLLCFIIGSHICVAQTNYVYKSGPLSSPKPHSQRYNLRSKLPALTLAALSGVAKGLQDADAHGTKHLKGPFFGPDSWKNKYKHNDPAMGPAFPGSTTIFVATTDFWHLMDLSNSAFLIGAGVMIVQPNSPKWHKLVDALLIGTTRLVAFNVVYNSMRDKPIFGLSLRF